jgi:dinuclear metal center YbgI/SA1388 family protein
MTTIAEVVAWLEQFAPARLAEAWDNVGLLWGDPGVPVERIMACLTVTRTTAAEAIAERAALVLSHHPVLFRAVKKIRADSPETGYLWRMARAGIAIASPHTAFDNTAEGINDTLCRRLGLVNLAPLRPIPAAAGDALQAARLFKVVVFTPESDRDAVSAAAFAAGAGHIGAYRECSFAIPGEGTFFGTEGANPAVGERGRRETVRELRFEVVCPAHRLGDVLTAIRAHHSYEEPAIDVYPLQDSAPAGQNSPGAGRIGQLGAPQSSAEFAASVSQAMGGITVALAGDPDRRIERIAVVCGAGDDFLEDAARAGADLLLTGEARFHRVLEADARGIGLLTTGHFASERLGVQALAGRVAHAFPGLTVWASQTERDPFRLIGPPSCSSEQAAAPIDGRG